MLPVSARLVPQIQVGLRSQEAGAVQPVRPVPSVKRGADEARIFDSAATVEISDEARSRLAQAIRGDAAASAQPIDDAPADGETGDGGGAPQASGSKEPTTEEQKKIAELKARDQEVRAHEQAHKSAGGQHAGAIHYEYERGPDGERYAVGGHVNIDVSPVKGDARATLTKMDQVRRAALAPADPSGADRAVAAQAAANAADARAELAEQRYKEQESGDSTSSEPGSQLSVSA